MLKKLFKIGMLAGALLLASNANAQTDNEYPRYGFWSNWSFGGTLLYSWEYEHGGLFDWREGSNIGVNLFFEKELNHVWAMRLIAETPGLWKAMGNINAPAYDRDGIAYDRYGKAGVDFKFSINNAIKGYDPERKGSLYLMLGTGLAFHRDDINLGDVSMYMQGGLGYSYKICEHSTIFAELKTDICADIPNPVHQWHDMAGMLGIGWMYNWGPTQSDLDMLAQKASVSQDQMDATNAELEQAKKDLRDAKAKQAELENKVRTIESNNNPYVKNNNNDKVIDSLQRIIDSYENDKDNFYAMPFSILYAVDQSDVPADQMNKVKAIAQIMKDSDYDFEIIGYCDNSGSKEYNQKLSEKRAEKVKKLLVDKYGIDGDRLTTSGKGKDIAFGDIKNAVNRRVSFYRKNK